MTKVVEFSRGAIRTYLGNVSDYLDARERAGAEKAAAAGRAALPQTSDKERKRLEAEERQRRYRKTKPVRDRIAKVEKQVEGLEAEKAHVEQLMADPDFYRDGERAKNTAARYKEIERLLADAYFRWNELTKELEKLSGRPAGDA